jgi:Uma2 family endonuclease
MSSAPSTFLRPIPPAEGRRKPPKRKLTEEEFVRWCDDKTWAEWVDGEVILMNAVALDHADVVAFLIHLVRAYVEDHELGKVLTEPFQVRFEKLRRRRAPDLIFIANNQFGLFQKTAFNGAPDLIIEVVSPDSQSRDRREKFLEYQAVGVREYWIIDMPSRSVEAYAMQRSAKFAMLEESAAGAIDSTVLKGFYIKPVWLWQPTFPKVSALLKEFARRK